MVFDIMPIIILYPKEQLTKYNTNATLYNIIYKRGKERGAEWKDDQFFWYVASVGPVNNRN